MIKKAGPSDSGNYTCKPSIAREASIKVHVLESKFESKDQLIYGGHRGSYTVGELKDLTLHRANVVKLP